MNQGYIKLHRKILDNPIVCKDSDHLAVWIYLLVNATHKSIDVVFNGKKTKLKKGQLITGRKVITESLSISESKVQRILKWFESEQQIEQQTSRHNRLITICSWNKYQTSEQQNEQVMNNKRTTNEQLMNTNKNVKNVKNVKNSSCLDADKSFYSRLSDRDISNLHATYKDATMLILEVAVEVEKKHHKVEKPYQYIVGYADNKNWERK